VKRIGQIGRIGPIAIHCRHDKLVAASALQLHPANPKTHPPEQLRVYAKIIRGNGWRRAVVVSKRSGFVVKGNGAVLACLAHGIGQVPVEYQSYPTDASELRDLNADNALAALGETDEAKLTALLKQLDGTDPELAGIVQALDGPVELKRLPIREPPALGWCLIGMPLKKWGQLAPLIERIARLAGVQLETTVADEHRDQD
jgi:hypothetical protein